MDVFTASPVRACLLPAAARYLARTKSRQKKAGIVSRLFSFGERIQAESALICALRRLLWRAALFLWMMPLSAIRSMTGTALS